MRNANKSYNSLLRSDERNRKVIQNPYPGPDYHQKLVGSYINIPNHKTKCQWNRLITFAVILHTEQMTDKPTWMHNQ